MITDLAEEINHDVMVETDVLIVGAGIAGIFLAVRLRRLGIRVVILESGSRTQAEKVHPLNRVVQLGDSYNGASAGRFRCLGGTSTRWGGALIPFAPSDLLPRTYLNLSGFPIEASDITKYINDVEGMFGVDDGSYEEDFVNEIHAEQHIPIGDPDFRARFAKWPTFKRRNVAKLFEQLLERDPDLHISLNSTAVRFDVDRTNGSVRSVLAQHQSGRSILVTAKHCVICAGAIEATRLLLTLNRGEDQRPFSGCEAVGRYFYDHVSMAVAALEATDVQALNRLAGFRFVGSTMRSMRYEVSAEAQRRERVPNAFAHISFKTKSSSGFDALRELMRARQKAGGIAGKQLADVFNDIPYLLEFGAWRLWRKQLLWPKPASYDLHIVAEQLPQYGNRLSLTNETDLLGMPIVSIDWQFTEKDLRTFVICSQLFEQFWNRRGLGKIAALDWKSDPDSLQPKQTSQADVFHPGGSVRMGRDRSSAVVDPDLLVFGFQNLWVASTAVFPSGGGANPTLTLILFTLRLADQLALKLR